MHRLLLATPASTLAKAALTACLIALAILSWMPAPALPRTALGGHAEHLIAYLGTAMVMGLASRTASQLATHCLLLMGYAALLEAGQLYAVGRHATFMDLGFSAAGALLGTVLIGIARRAWVRPR